MKSETILLLGKFTIPGLEEKDEEEEQRIYQL